MRMLQFGIAIVLVITRSVVRQYFKKGRVMLSNDFSKRKVFRNRLLINQKALVNSFLFDIRSKIELKSVGGVL